MSNISEEFINQHVTFDRNQHEITRLHALHTLIVHVGFVR